MRDMPSLIYHFPELSPPNTTTKELRGIQGSPEQHMKHMIMGRHNHSCLDIENVEVMTKE